MGAVDARELRLARAGSGRAVAVSWVCRCVAVAVARGLVVTEVVVAVARLAQGEAGEVAYGDGLAVAVDAGVVQVSHEATEAPGVDGEAELFEEAPELLPVERTRAIAVELAEERNEVRAASARVRPQLGACADEVSRERERERNVREGEGGRCLLQDGARRARRRLGRGCVVSCGGGGCVWRSSPTAQASARRLWRDARFASRAARSQKLCAAKQETAWDTRKSALYRCRGESAASSSKRSATTTRAQLA